MAEHSSNKYLSLSEMQDNANIIIDFFRYFNWTDNAIAAMLGNMQRESTINPGLWQNQDEGNTSLGLGLVQWTPATKLIEWCEGYNLDYLSLMGQCSRISYELNNNLQYYPTPEYPETFKEFSQSTKSVEYLTTAFLKNYERAGVEALDERIENAKYWFSYIDNGYTPDGGGGSGGGTGTITRKKSQYKFHLFKKRRIF